jgi:hypothetical protein
MRTRKRTDTRLRCYKYHCWLKSQADALLPAPIYNATKRQQALWNQLVTEQDRRYQAWRKAHPAISLGICRGVCCQPGNRRSFRPMTKLRSRVIKGVG